MTNVNTFTREYTHMPDFVHLHCHTEYSLLDGAIRLKELCGRAKDLGLPAAAITDHGNMYGAINFYLAAKSHGIKPIIGCEVYVTPDHTDRVTDAAKIRNHLVLLAADDIGYHNLIKLVSQAALHGFYYSPRVDKKLLMQHSEGVIALSACLGGDIPQAILKGDMDEALRVTEEYKRIYPDRFYLEVQENGLAEQRRVNEKLLEIAEKARLPLVATNDCHYLNADDVEAHDILLCIQTQAKVTDEKRMRFETRDLYYKTPEQMEREFAWAPNAVANTAVIAVDRCKDYNFDFKTSHFPVYALPEGMTLDEEFRRLAREGLEERFQKSTTPLNEEEYRARLELELDVICKMGYPGYFLIVQDFINWGKNNGVPVGPGRGSAAGSLVAWALRITNLDPIPYNLLFERFLNPERVSLPDIDVDFCERNRHKVLKYVTERYGADSVAQITTFGTMKAKAVVRDVGRAMGMTFQETDRIAKLIPGALDMTLKKALESEADLKTLYDTDPQIKKLIDVSRRFEGMSRHASTHAAGVVISDRPMSDYVPLYRGKREEVVSQYDMKVVEKVGLVKFDFLGLKTMTLIQDTLELIAAQGQTPPNLDTLALDDVETYKLLASGDTDGIFQVESSGMRSYLRQLKPTVFGDIIAMLSLYRPGPMDIIPDFIDRKHGRQEVRYPLDDVRPGLLEPCLKDTYGVIVYQEQVMQIAQLVARYSLGGADILRRAMGKKNLEEMVAQRQVFLKGAAENGIGEKDASEVFDLMEKFAAYGFNKSHAAAYALITYHTAYLKTHHKAEFMAALLTSEMGNQDKVLKYVAACKDMTLTVEQPSAQESIGSFSVKNGNILFGLGGIKNVGSEAIDSIVEARQQGGPFSSLLDLCCRVNLRKVTKRVLENLIKGGACDCFGCNRAAMMAALDLVVARAQRKAKEKASGQNSLLSMIQTPSAPLPGLGFECDEAATGEWDNDTKLRFEKEALGFFLTSHPLQPFRGEIFRLGLTTLDECREMMPKQELNAAILVSGTKEILTKKGTRMAFCQVGDLTADAECVFFSEEYAKYRELLQSDQPLLLQCRIARQTGSQADDDSEDAEEEKQREIKLEAISVKPLAEASSASQRPVEIDLLPEHLVPDRLQELKHLLNKHRGGVSLYMNLRLKRPDGIAVCRFSLPGKFDVTPGPELEKALSAWMNG